MAIRKEHCFHFGLIHLFSKCLLSTYYIQASTVLGTGPTTINKTHKIFALRDYSAVETDNLTCIYLCLVCISQKRI